MSNITAATVKSLREKTGAGMLDCKKALDECGGDIEKSIDWLRKKGLSAAAKKSGRVAAEGLVGMMTNDSTTSGVLVEVNAETDFVARNDMFQQLVDDAVQMAMKMDMEKGDSNEALKTALAPAITNLIATIGENMNFRRAKKLSVDKGVIASYMHNALKPNAGKIGVLVALESTGDKTKLQELGKKLAMHIAAASPSYLNAGSVPADVIAREKTVLAEQAKTSGKPEAVIEKMVQGRIQKFYEEVALLEQTFIFDNETKITKMLENAEKEIGAKVAVKDFALFRLGEGIEKKQDDFAAEVASMAKN
ncbi:MAG: translation elongation factor Ts [Hydrotalea sp.]|nr:translation elongation factor Ts [Hydrotalea sp.]